MNQAAKGMSFLVHPRIPSWMVALTLAFTVTGALQLAIVHSEAGAEPEAPNCVGCHSHSDDVSESPQAMQLLGSFPRVLFNLVQRTR